MVELTQLACPLCGRFVSLAYFDPSRFDPDIYVVNVTGLGRGRGVKVTGRYSILHPGNITVELVKDRILNLAKVLVDHDCLKPQEVLSSLNIKTTDPKEILSLKYKIQSLEIELKEAGKERNQLHSKSESLTTVIDRYRTEFHKLKGEIEVLEANLEEVRKERNMWKNETETLEAQIEELEEKEFDYTEIYDMINIVESVLSEDFVWEVDEEQYPIEALKERLTDLINEYESLEAESE